MLKIIDVCKKFNAHTVNETTVFENFSLTVTDGEFVSVVGSNGSGKSTLLNLISGNVRPDAGRIILDETDITLQPEHVKAQKIGRVFQNPALATIPVMTITENMAIADNKGKPYGLASCVNKKRAGLYRELVSRLNLGLEDKMDVEVGALSGGQRQALALVICTMTDIRLLLLDEHTAALDPKTSEKIMELTNNIIAAKKITTLMVTHNLRFAAEYGDRILMMDDGKILLDKAGGDKASADIKTLLQLFNEISLEKGN
ncbi:MAG: ATP-binding cassette domain-containing protein [Clostridiales bacterium]|nr:ATP-binding cassette domain-containing protein [Clostridiales bacterium]